MHNTASVKLVFFQTGMDVVLFLSYVALTSQTLND